MSAPNGYLQKHTQTYLGTNPSPHGALTWRMTMIPGIEREMPDPDNLTSLNTVLPIDSRQDIPNQYTLFFNINSLPETRSTRIPIIPSTQAAGLVKLPQFNQRVIGVKSITGIAPINTVQLGNAVTVFFDINSLPESTRRKRSYRVSSSLYNSRSVDNLFADKPLFTSGDEHAVVTFDIQSLSPA